MNFSEIKRDNLIYGTDMFSSLLVNHPYIESIRISICLIGNDWNQGW